jgi:N-acyl-D-amino-acid deacylase
MMEGILKECRVAGATLAIARHGKLVLDKGYGLADRATDSPVRPDTLFCLASCTKPITAVAALKLVDDGKLVLDAPVADLLSDLKPLPGQEIVDPRVRDITVRHLLLHASGLPHDMPAAHLGVTDEGDQEGNLDEAELAYREMLGSRLEFKPGHEHRYSNFGFVVLRLVVERVSGQAYEAFVHDAILRPMGIRGMRLEKNHRTPGETERYLPNGQQLRRWNASNWLATARDLTRFLSLVAGSGGPTFLTELSTRQMLAPPPRPIESNPNGSHVGLGWDNVQETPQGVRFSKNGGKPGVSAWMEHLARKIDWVVMFNTARPGQPAPVPLALARQRFMATIEHIHEWPEIDLFDT